MSGSIPGASYPVSLPSADFSSEEEEEDVEDGCDGEANIFSRTDHIKSLGLSLGEADLGLSIGASVHDLELDSVSSGSSNILEHSRSNVGWRDGDYGSSSTNSWDAFKAEFTDKLREAEKTVEDEEEDNGEGPSSPPAPLMSQDDLFIEMITAFHDSKLDHGEPEALSASDLQGVAPRNSSLQNSVASVPKLQTSPTKPRKSLLSLSTLEAIQESDLDWSLENVDRMESGLECCGEDSETFTDENFTSPFSPASRIAWEEDGGKPNDGGREGAAGADEGKRGGEKDEASLMKQLQQLSRTQANGSTGFGESVMTEAALSTNSQQMQVMHPGREDRETVFLDLRPPRGSASSQDNMERQFATTEHSYNSDEDSDDDDTWEAQRRAIKGQHSSQRQVASSSKARPASPSSQHSTDASNKDHAPLPHPQAHIAQPHLSSSSSSPSTSSTPQQITVKHLLTTDSHTSLSSLSSSNSHSSSNSAHNLHTVHRIPPSPQSPCTSHHLHSDTPPTVATTPSHSETTHKQDPPSSSGDVLAKRHSPKQQEGSASKRGPSRRTRTHNSSSFSEGEVPTSPECAGNSLSGTSEELLEKGDGKSASSSSKVKNSKKKGRKTKKSGKKEASGQSSSTSSSSQSKERSEASKRRRAHVLQRIRRDSWNTSSDEDHTLSSNTSSESLGQSDSVFLESSQTDLKKEDRNAQRSVDQIREDLRKRIFSKKPPAYFETPATDPVYHEEVSYTEPVRDHTLSNSGTGAMLELPITCHGLIALPTPWPDKLPWDRQMALFCLVLTWLVARAASREMGKHRHEGPLDAEEGLADDLQDGDIPFGVAGIQYTILDGHPAVLVGVERLEGKRTADILDNTKPFSDTVQEYLSTTTLGEVIEPLTQLDPVKSGTIEVSSLSSILKLPLGTFFSYHEDSSPLSSPVSFYWYSGYHQSSLPSPESLFSRHPPATTVFTLLHTSLSSCLLLLSILWSAVSGGLSVVGLRTIYGCREEDDYDPNMIKKIGGHASSDDVDSASLCLVVALRGPNAIQSWMDVVGPRDSKLAKITDPSSLSAKFGSHSVQTLTTPYRSISALAKWFGGRACLKTSSILGMSDFRTKSERRKRQRVRFSETQSESEDSISSPMVDLAFPPLVSNRPRLLVPAYVKTVLAISPAVPLACYGCVLSCCAKLGFDIFGSKRVRLNSKRAALLDIPDRFLASFTPSSTPSSPEALSNSSSSHPLRSSSLTSRPGMAPLPSTLLILGRENGRVHSYALQSLIVQKLRCLAGNNPHVVLPLGALETASGIVHMTNYSEEKLKHFGSFSAAIAQAEDVKECKMEGDDYREELGFVAIPGPHSLPLVVSFLDSIFHVETPSELFHQGRTKSRELEKSEKVREPELIGMKIISQLSRFHSKKLCPFAAKHQHYSRAVQFLTDKPTVLLVFRGMACAEKIQNHVKAVAKLGSSHLATLEEQLSFIIPSKPLETVKLCSAFFSGKELYSDPVNWPLAPYYPQAWVQEADLLQNFLSPRENLFTVVQLPLGGQMGLALKVLDRLTRTNFQVAGMSTVECLSRNEPPTEEGRGTRLVMCLERCNAVWAAQEVVRPFTKDRVTSHLAWSLNFESAVKEIKSNFPDGIWTTELSSVLKEIDIPVLGTDVFSNLVISEACLKDLRSSFAASYVSPLNERTAILLLPSLMGHWMGGETDGGRGSGFGGWTKVLEVLHKGSFQLCGVKVVMMSKDSAREIKIMCSADISVEDMCSGPSLVVVLERDNAASCFQLVLKSVFNRHYITDHTGSLFSSAIIPNDSKQAKQLLEFLQCC